MSGSLTLRAAASAGAPTVLAEQRHSGALRVLRPLYLDRSGQVSVTIVNPGGGMLDGDRYRLDATVEAGADLQLTTQSATKVYRTPQDRAESLQRIALRPNARLEMVPDSVIAYAGARFRQFTDVDMEASASLALAEIATPGWSPEGVPHAYEELTLVTRVRRGGRLLLHDRLRFTPENEHPAQRLLTQGFSHVGTLVIVDPRCDAAAIDALRGSVGAFDAPGERGALVGVTALSQPGCVVRALTTSTPAARRILLDALDWTRRNWHDQDSLDLRKP